MNGDRGAWCEQGVPLLAYRDVERCVDDAIAVQAAMDHAVVVCRMPGVLRMSSW